MDIDKINAVYYENKQKLLNHQNDKKEALQAYSQLIAEAYADDDMDLDQDGYKSKPAFSLSTEGGHRGFQVRFRNGYTVSVQFGKANYSDGGQTTAEVAVLDAEGDMVSLQGKDRDDVLARVSPEKVAEIFFDYASR